MTTAELLALTPFQFLTRNEGPITDWDKWAQDHCYSDDFKDKYGFRPRYRSITEDELRNFYNSNYKVREYAGGVSPFDGESTVYLGFSDARAAEIEEEHARTCAEEKRSKKQKSCEHSWVVVDCAPVLPGRANLERFCTVCGKTEHRTLLLDDEVLLRLWDEQSG